jgi:hypothetical protein
MTGACEGGRQRTAMILAAAAGIAVCLLMCTVSSRLCAESWETRSIRLVSYTTRTTHIAANGGTSLRLCSGRSRLNATAAAAKRTYQQFLLDDAARRHGDLQHAAWAGDASDQVWHASFAPHPAVCCGCRWPHGRSTAPQARNIAP